MSKVWLLVTNYFNNYIGNLGKSKNKSKYALGGGIILLFGLIFIILFTSMAITTMDTALSIDHPYPELALYITMGMMCMFLLLLAVTRATSNKKHNDEELLLSLPFKKSHIVISKILYNYLFDLICVASTLLPSAIVYYVYMYNSAVFSTPDIGYFPRFVYLLLLIPLLSNAVGSLIGILFEQLTKNFRNANVIRSIVSVVFLVFFLIGYYALQYYLQIMVTIDSDFSIDSIFILKGLVDFVTGNKLLLPGIIISAVCIIPFIVCVVLQSIFLGKEETSKSTKTKKLKYKRKMIFTSLLRQEIGKYFNSSTYVMNTLFGGIILIILSLAYLIFGKNFLIDKIEVLSSVKIEFLLPYIEMIFIAICLLIISTCTISASSISFEGKNIWIVKAHPVKEVSVFLSKILTHFLICFICILLSTFLLGIRFIIDNEAIGIVYTLGFFVIMVLFSLIEAIIGLLINLMFPRLEWTNETEVIKQSISVGITLIVGIMIVVLLILPCIFIYKYIEPYWCMLIVILSEVFVLILSTLLLTTLGKKLYKKL